MGSEVFDAIIQEYHGISPTAKHTSDMDPEKIKGNVNEGVPVHSTRIRVGRSIDGFGLSPGITKTFLLWVNEEDQMRIISMEKGGDVKGVFSRLARGIKAVGDSVKAECGKDFALSERFGYIHSC